MSEMESLQEQQEQQVQQAQQPVSPVRCKVRQLVPPWAWLQAQWAARWALCWAHSSVVL